MKKTGKILAGLLSLCLAFYIGSVDCYGAQTGQYTYTVTLRVGNHGEVRKDAASAMAGQPGTVEIKGDAIVVSGLPYGSQVNFQAQDLVNSSNGKYYVKGTRLSGRDDLKASYTVTRDQDFVVAYGVTGDQVSYRVNYQDEAGNTLAESRTYYGNIGDMPVVAFRYIDGYQPQAYNLTKTLSANEAENIFTFIYKPVPESGGSSGGGTTGGNTGGQTTGGTGGGQQTTGGQTTAPTVPGGAGTGTPATAPGAPANPVPGGAAGPAGVNPGADDPNEALDDNPVDNPDDNTDDNPVEVPDDEVPLDDGPEDIVNLDDDEVPLADIPGTQEAAHGRRMSAVAVAVGVVGAAALIALLICLIMKRRKTADK